MSQLRLIYDIFMLLLLTMLSPLLLFALVVSLLP